MENYTKEAIEKAIDAVEEGLVDEIVESLTENDSCPEAFNDYKQGERFVYEQDFGNNWLKPKDAVELLLELDEFEETDNGLWEGQKEWREIVKIIAGHTFQNAVYSKINEILVIINSDFDFDEIKSDFLNNKDDLNKTYIKDDGDDQIARTIYEKLLSRINNEDDEDFDEDDYELESEEKEFLVKPYVIRKIKEFAN